MFASKFSAVSGLDYGMLSFQLQTFTWNNTGVLLIRPLGTTVNEISIKMLKLLSNMPASMSSTIYFLFVYSPSNDRHAVISVNMVVLWTNLILSTTGWSVICKYQNRPSGKWPRGHPAFVMFSVDNSDSGSSIDFTIRKYTTEHNSITMKFKSIVHMQIYTRP